MFDFDARGLPLGLLILVLIVIPVCIGVFFGLFAWKRVTPLVFRCRRCESDFARKAWLAFPVKCPKCGARDWNAE